MEINTFEFRYNVTGPARKQLVRAIGEIRESRPKYLGAPDFSFKVDYFTIDRNGTVSFDDRADSDEIEILVERLQSEYGFIPEPADDSGQTADAISKQPQNASIEVIRADSQEYSNMTIETPGNASNNDLMERFDTSTAEETQLKNELSTVDMPVQNLETKGIVQPADIPEQPKNASEWTIEADLEEYTSLTIEMPKNASNNDLMENLNKLVAGKAGLIKKALSCEDLSIEVTEDKIRFPWFRIGADPEMVKAYTHFVTALYEMAGRQKRVFEKELVTDNEKYSFRCFLLRLGFIGKEYKTERKILLRNLTGSSAFRTPKGADNE